jgi:DNA-binding transcriptional LysR family regulator
LPKLYEQYPNLKIDLMLEERVLDLPMREADVAIRMKEPSQADLVRKRLFNVTMRLYASQKYLDQFGKPQTLAEIANHRLICQSPSTPQVGAGAQLVASLLANDVTSTLTVNSYFGVLQAVIHDLGIGVLPQYLTVDFPDLVRVLPEVESAEVPVYLAYPEELRQSQRIAAFRDFVQNEIAETRRANPNEPPL